MSQRISRKELEILGGSPKAMEGTDTDQDSHVEIKKNAPTGGIAKIVHLQD